MINKLNLKDAATIKKILDLQLASYTVEAEIIDFYEIPALKDTADNIKECNEIFYGYYLNNILAGIISYKVFKNILDIHRVAVHPHYFRMKIAEELIMFTESIESGINKVIVCTGKKNFPAINLYLKIGYKKIRDIEIKKGIYITEFFKEI